MKISFNLDDNIHPENMAVIDKTDRQLQAIEKWRTYGKGIGTILAIPRFGKTRMGIIAIDKFFQKHNRANVIVIVPNDAVKNQWRKEIEYYNENINKLKGYIIVESIFRVKTINPNNNKRLIIVDEIHKYVTTTKTYNRVKSICDNNFVLGLTGSLPTDSEHLRRFNELAPVVDTITEEEAIENKWITKYTEYNIPLAFPFDLQRRYVLLSEHIAETLQLFKGTAKLINSLDIYDNIYLGFKSDYEVITACYVGRKDITSGRYLKPSEVREIVGKANGWKIELNLHNDYDKQIEQYWSPSNIYKRVYTFNNFVRERNEIINNHPSKIQTINNIIFRTKLVPTLIYVKSIEFAEELATTLNNIATKEIAICYHSKIKSRPLVDINTGDFYKYKSGKKKDLPMIFGKIKLKRKYIEYLQSGVIKILITVESLNEGLNVPNLKRVIIAGASNNPITHYQRANRVRTIDENDIDKVSEVINIYFDDFTYSDKNELIISRDKSKIINKQFKLNIAPVITTVSNFISESTNKNRK